MRARHHYTTGIFFPPQKPDSSGVLQGAAAACNPRWSLGPDDHGSALEVGTQQSVIRFLHIADVFPIGHAPYTISTGSLPLPRFTAPKNYC